MKTLPEKSEAAVAVAASAAAGAPVTVKSTPIRKIVESSFPLNTIFFLSEMDPKDFLVVVVFVVVIAPHVTNNRLDVVRLTETNKAVTRVNLDKV
jgi:hypothetical protein